MKKIKINEIDILFTQRKKQKNIRLYIQKDGMIALSAPSYCSEKKAVEFAYKNFEWIKKHLHMSEKRIFTHDSTLSIMGSEYQIIHNPNQKGGLKKQNNSLSVGGSEVDFIHRRVSNFAKKELLTYLNQKAFEMAKKIDKTPSKITLKDTSSRWGSCSSKGNLNFCWKIALSPLFVIDYLIAHEVSHLKEMNHGEKFWQTVSKLNVNQAEAEIWLRKNGKELMKIK